MPSMTPRLPRLSAVRPRKMQLFELHRDIDESGVSGTGIVAEGVLFSDGTAAMRWRSDRASTAIYSTMDDVWLIHGHNGATRLVWL
jgi:hypothetical protein